MLHKTERQAFKFKTAPTITSNHRYILETIVNKKLIKKTYSCSKPLKL